MNNRSRHITALIVILFLAGTTLAAPAQAADGGQRRNGPATLEYREGMPFLTLSGSYYDMGFQYGTLMKDEVTKAYADMDRSREAFFSMVPAILRPLARLVFKHMASKKEKTIPPNYRDEMRGFAEATGFDYDYIVNMTFTTDIVGSLGCTSAVVTGGTTLIHGRNLDFPPTTIGRYPLVVDYRPAGKRPYTLLGVAGYLPALSGMNEAGISITLNLSFMTEDYKKPGMPVGYKIREILESAASLKEIDALMNGYASDQGWFFTIASAPDRSGAIYNIAGGEVRKSPLSGSCAFVENRFLFEDMNMKYKTLEDSGGDYNENRTKTVGERLAKVRSVDDMTAMLRSTDYYGYQDVNGKFTVNNYETVQSMVLLPGTGDIYFASAPMYAGFSKMIHYNRKTGNVSVYREADPRMSGKEMQDMIAWADLLYADPKKAAKDLEKGEDASLFQLALVYRLWKFDNDLIDLAKLIPSMERAIVNIPDDATFYVMKGDALLSVKKFDEAASVLEQGLKSRIAAPGDTMMLHALLAKACGKIGKQELASQHAVAALTQLTRYQLKGEQKKLKCQLERIR